MDSNVAFAITALIIGTYAIYVWDKHLKSKSTFLAKVEAVAELQTQLKAELDNTLQATKAAQDLREDLNKVLISQGLRDKTK